MTSAKIRLLVNGLFDFFFVSVIVSLFYVIRELTGFYTEISRLRQGTLVSTFRRGRSFVNSLLLLNIWHFKITEYKKNIFFCKLWLVNKTIAGKFWAWSARFGVVRVGDISTVGAKQLKLAETTFADSTGIVVINISYMSNTVT